MGFFSRGSSDNSNLSSNDTQQMNADARVLATGNDTDRAQAANLAWAVNENDRNQNTGR